MKKPELLAPAGNLEKLKKAFLYGADAVYIGGEEFSLRVAAENFTLEEMREGIAFAHARGGKVYLTANIIPHNRDIEAYAQYLNEVKDMGLDAVILSDLGMFQVTRELAPDLEIHVSTQANNVNYRSARAWRDMGAKRVILAREMSLAEIKEIREKVQPDLELEAFVHGAMCISYSGRCLLSNYMAGRDSNQGNCAHPCRWKYHLMEEQRPGEYMPVFENERGTFIYNSKDLCMIEHMDQLIASGLSSFKIEGRVKSEFYVATVVQAYRQAIDAYFEDPEHYVVNPEWLEEIKKVSHRDYTTGFYFGKPGATEQNYATSSYIRDYEMVGMVTGYNPETGLAEVIQKNRFFRGSTVEFVRPVGKFFSQTVTELYDENGVPLEVANRPQSKVYLKTQEPVEPDTFIRQVRTAKVTKM
ncbi:MAG: U32 family peptidase C-terminal domain-containing protein [Clostridia bacterium]|nr:U32 family peptidase C-terminal domain-containing protein [Clostridia bacterium]